MTRVLLAIAFCLSAAAMSTGASAQGKVNVVRYAAENPVADASLRSTPVLGASVPSSVELQQIEGAPNFGYFYFQSQPVIVDLRTRAIVKIGN